LDEGAPSNSKLLLLWMTSFGPMARMKKSFITINGFRVTGYFCSKKNECGYHCRIYYPMGDEFLHNTPTHGTDTDGGKLLSFGYIALKPKGKKKSNYSHLYYPLVFTHILNENFSSAVYTLTAMGSTVEHLLGFNIEFRGGLISDHAQSLVNTYAAVLFPMSIRGQCYPHVLLKWKDQWGRRSTSSTFGRCLA
jgi:hypothetical protein